MSVCGEIENTQTTILLYKSKLRRYLKQKEETRDTDLHIYHVCKGLICELQRRSMLEEIATVSK